MPQTQAACTTWSASAASRGRDSRPVRFSPPAMAAGRPAHGPVSPRVPATHRLLDPGEFDAVLDPGEQPYGLVPAPGLVDVEHQGGGGGVGAQHLGDREQPADVVFGVEAALELGAGEAACGPAGVQLDQLLLVQRDVEAGRVTGHVSVGGAEGAPQRLAGHLRLEVPQRHVEGADGAEGGAGVTALEGVGQHPVVERGDGAWVLPVEGGEDPPGLAVCAEAHSGEPAVGLDQQDRDLGDALGDEAVRVPDGTPPVVRRGQAPESGDLQLLPLFELSSPSRPPSRQSRAREGPRGAGGGGACRRARGTGVVRPSGSVP
ncbi:hypothetical protein STENM36S_09322 [Streptomyces tendae]